MWRFLTKILILLSFCIEVSAQDSARIVLRQQVEKEKITVNTFASKKSAEDAIAAQLITFYESGFLEAHVEDTRKWADTILVIYSKGPKYQFGKVDLSQIPANVLNGSGIVARDFSARALSPQTIARLASKLLTYAENNGYPFAKAYFEQIEIDEKRQFNAKLMFDAGREVRIDEIKVHGSVEVEPQFLESYIGIKKSSRYDERLLRDLSKKLANLAYLKEEKPWALSFTIDKNTLDLFLAEKKANQINALIGLQPSNQETQRFLWTADVLLALHNALGYGEQISASFKNLQRRSPQLNVSVMAPYLLRTNVGADASFEFFRRDTIFRRTAAEGGLRYLFSPGDYLRVFFQSTKNRVQFADTAFVRQNKILPQNGDLNARGAGVDFVMQRTNNLYNPLKGWSAIFSMSALERKVLPNDAILAINDGSGFDFGQLYTEANAQKLQYKAKAQLAFYQPIFRNFVLKVGYNGGLLSGQGLFKNELFQLGGFKLLRGFEEQSIYAQQYHLATLELRTLINPQSFLYVFSDGGYFQSSVHGKQESNRPLSFGAGITLQNTTGIFNVALALGKLQQTPFQFRNVQIHFGYVALF